MQEPGPTAQGNDGIVDKALKARNQHGSACEVLFRAFSASGFVRRLPGTLPQALVLRTFGMIKTPNNESVLQDRNEIFCWWRETIPHSEIRSPQFRRWKTHNSVAGRFERRVLGVLLRTADFARLPKAARED